MTIRTVEDEVFHADGQTDMKRLTVAFRNFGNASNKMRTRHKCLTARSDKLFSECTRMSWGTRWRRWLRHCSTSRKVAGSIPDGVRGIFH